MEKLSMNDINALKPLQLLDDGRVQSRLTELHQKLHGTNKDQADMFFNRESHNLKKIISSNNVMNQCTGFSLYGVFMDLVSMNLTLDDTGQELLYLSVRNVNVGTKQNPVWEKRFQLDVSPYGELAARINAGQLAYSDRPVVVFEGDEFKPRVNEKGEKVVVYEAAVPRKSTKIIGGFIRHVRPNGSFDFYWMLEDDIKRLAGFSERQNKGKTNRLYTSNNGQIDTGFLEAKIIKHSFKTFPRIPLGQFSTIQEEPLQAEDYGLESGEAINQREPIKPHLPPEEVNQQPETETEPEPEENEVQFAGSEDEPF